MVVIHACAEAPTWLGDLLVEMIHREARALFRLDGKTLGTTIITILYTHGVDLGTVCVVRHYALKQTQIQ